MSCHPDSGYDPHKIWRQLPGMTISVDWDLKYQFKQNKTNTISEKSNVTSFPIEKLIAM